MTTERYCSVCAVVFANVARFYCLTGHTTNCPRRPQNDGPPVHSGEHGGRAVASTSEPGERNSDARAVAGDHPAGGAVVAKSPAGEGHPSRSPGR